MQWDRFNARSAVKVARLSGTCEKRLADKSNDWRVFARGPRLDAGIEVRELSAKLRCRKKRHLDAGKIPMESRLDELPRG
jgi:hypothetical protein